METKWLFCPLSSQGYKWTRPATEAKIGSMRQILNMPSTPGCHNAFTCDFSARKGRCARGFRILPHTSVQRFQKCGAKPRSADQTPVLPFRDLRFCCKKSSCARQVSIFPRTSGERGLHREVKHKKVIRDNIQLSRKHQRAVAGNRTTTLLCHRLT